MFSVQFDRQAQLLTLRLREEVTAEEVSACRAQTEICLLDAQPGFRLLTDLSELRWMEVACAHELGVLMDLLAAKKVSLIVRVIPDPQKDIGLTILSRFHYGPEVELITCSDLGAAQRELGVELACDPPG